MERWCEGCDRPVEGEVCEVCGEPVPEPTSEPFPWRWRLFLLASVIYLGYRFYQIGTWIAHR